MRRKLSSAHSPRNGLWTRRCCQQAYYAPTNHARLSPRGRNPCTTTATITNIILLTVIDCHGYRKWIFRQQALESKCYGNCEHFVCRQIDRLVRVCVCVCVCVWRVTQSVRHSWSSAAVAALISPRRPKTLMPPWRSCQNAAYSRKWDNLAVSFNPWSGRIWWHATGDRMIIIVIIIIIICCHRFVIYCMLFTVLLSSRKVLVLVIEDQFTSPCPCPRTSSPCPCHCPRITSLCPCPLALSPCPQILSPWQLLLVSHLFSYYCCKYANKHSVQF